MVFSSSIFLFYFLPLVCLAYFSLKKLPVRNLVLVLASLFFYFAGAGVHLWVMVYSILMNYGLALAIHREARPRTRKFYLVVCILLNLLPLFYFKYYNFTLANLNSLFAWKIPARDILMPIGISFFTFQAMSYTIDIYRREAPVQKNPLNVALYISLFPQLIAGPIVRYETVALEIKNRTHSWEDAYYGLMRVMLGFSNKILLANQMALVANYYFDDLAGKTDPVGFLLAMVSYSFQIYYDFSGYSDMAIGLGRIFGFHFLENFNFPYISRSITEFWRRWHISLSSWFRDYVYIPLGGNRRGLSRQIFNLLVVWFLTGLWHGSYWNYILWGLYYFLLLMVEKFFLKSWGPKVLSHVLTLTFIFFGWVIFRCEDLTVLANLVRSLLGHSYLDGQVAWTWKGLLASTDAYVLVNYGLTFCLAILFSMPLEKWALARAEGDQAFSLLVGLGLLVIFLLALVYMLTGGFNPFIYFRF